MDTTTDTTTDTTEADVLRAAFNGLTASKDAAMFLAETAADGLRSTREALCRQVGERPWTTLGACAGAGFVVAGGLASPAFMGIVRLGARVALADVSRRLTAALLEVQTAAPSAPPEAPSAAAPAAAAKPTHTATTHGTHGTDGANGPHPAEAWRTHP